MTRRLLVTLGMVLATTVVQPASSQDATPPGPGTPPAPAEAEPEAPATLWDTQVGDVSVVLDADGTWTSRLAGGWGSGFTERGALPGLGYPGYERGLVFSQVPDFSLTLRLVERYYVEIAYRGLDDRSYLVGYQGKKGELVQWVKAGNGAFGVPERAGERLADGRRGAPAAGLALSAGPVDLEALVRYEDGSRETKTFRGFTEVTGSTNVGTWIRGRFFRLPGPYPVSGVRVLVADAEAPGGQRYREAEGSEVAVEPATGEVRLSSPATRTFWITWDRASDYDATDWSPRLKVPAEPATLAEPGSWLVLVRPGSPSFFEVRNRYAVAKGTQGEIVLVDDRDQRVEGSSVSYSPTQDWFEVSGAEEAPFWDRGGVFEGLYPGQGSPAPAPVTTVAWRFRLPAGSATSFYSLGTDILGSSVVVTRNGAVVPHRFDPGTGRLELDVPVFESDVVVVSFQRTKASGKASDLVLWQAGRWSWSDTDSLEWSLQGRWNLEGGAYTTEDLQSPGRVAGSLGWTGTQGDWSWKASGTLGALLADSTGHRRLYGWSDGGTQATLDGNALRPSAPPGSLGTPSLSLGSAQRAPTLFRDYWTYDTLTGQPQAGAWGSPGVNPSPWEADGWTGPYVVRGDGERSERLVVVEADLAPGTWSGAQVFLDAGRPRDLGSTSAVTVHLRIVDAQAGDRVFLQIGTLAEDFDGTGALRSQEYRTHPALGFVDQGVRRYFPVPEGTTWGNDAEGDGAAGGDGDLVSLELFALGSTPTDGAWHETRWVLTSAQRQLLARTTGWRVVVANPSGTAGVRTLLVGPVVLEGATWSVVPDGAAGSVSPVEEADPGSDGHHLRVDWAGRTSWTVEGRHASVRPASYRTLAFRYKLVSAGAAPVTVTLSNAQDRGWQFTWTAAPSSQWAEVRVGRDRSLSVDGVPQAASVDLGSADTWDRMRLSVGSGAASGTLYVAEVEAIDPVWEPQGNSVVETRWRQAQPWPPEAPLVSGVVVDLRSRQGGLTADQARWQGDSTVSGTFGPLRATAEASFVRTATVATNHGAYEATLPLGAAGVSLEWNERFSDRGLRSERVKLVAPWVGTWEALARVEGVPDRLDQRYGLSWATEGVGAGAKVAAQWDQSRPTDFELTGFGDQWVRSWSWLVPPADLAPYHRVQAEATGKVTPGGWGLEGQVQGAATQTLNPGVKWSPEGSWNLKAPLTFVDWTLTPSVGKKTEGRWTGQAARSPWASAQAAGAWVATQDAGLVALPFAEVLRGGPWADLEAGAVSSTAGVEWTRAQGSEWTDVVVPSSANVKLATTRGQEGRGDYLLGTASAAVQARAMNVFGTLGSLPIASWYRTDVWTWAATGSRTEGTRAQDRAADASVATRVDLVLSDRESLGLPTTYQAHWGTADRHAVGFKPTWSLKSPADLPFDIPRWLSPKGFRRLWIQDLSAAADLAWDQTTSPVVRNFQAGWKGRLVLSEKSEVVLGARWGQQWQQNLMVVGLEASVDLILSF